ncbi:MAG: hypothetical protein H8K04_02315 [Nitrospira sp.]
MELIASGQGTPSIIQLLHREEERKLALTKDLEHLQELANTVSLDEKRITRRLREELGQLPSLLGRHISLTRQMIRKLLDGHILCEPILEGGKPGYRFTATGTFDRLLTGASLINHGGGGEGS